MKARLTSSRPGKLRIRQWPGSIPIRRKLADARGRSRPATKPRTHQSSCMPAGVPSDQFGAATRNTSIGGNPFICGCSMGEMNQ